MLFAFLRRTKRGTDDHSRRSARGPFIQIITVTGRRPHDGGMTAFVLDCVLMSPSAFDSRRVHSLVSWKSHWFFRVQPEFVMPALLHTRLGVTTLDRLRNLQPPIIGQSNGDFNSDFIIIIRASIY